LTTDHVLSQYSDLVIHLTLKKTWCIGHNGGKV
jgi:hypothetical protein